MRYRYEEYFALERAFESTMEEDAPRVERAIHSAIADLFEEPFEISIEDQEYRRWVTLPEEGPPAVIEVGGISRHADLHLRVSTHPRHRRVAETLHDLIVKRSVEIVKSETQERVLKKGEPPEDDLPF